jgi:hypothetical protein
MGGDRAQRIEAAVERLAAAAFGGAVAFAAFAFTRHTGIPAVGFTTGAGVLSYVVCRGVLGFVRPGQPRLRLPDFELEHFEPAELEELLLTEWPELVLTDGYKVQPQAPHTSGELLLEDILAEIQPESRVVRLFDPAQMPTPGQLNARIEQHLNHGTPPAAPPDASQALYDALAALKRSLR